MKKATLVCGGDECNLQASFK